MMPITLDPVGRAPVQLGSGAWLSSRRGGLGGLAGQAEFAQVRERYSDEVDALLDLVSSDPEALNAYAAVVRDGGRIASSVGAAGEGPDRTNVSALPGRENLERLAELLENGTLTVPIQASYPMAQADQALKALTSQHTQGKLAITLP